MKKQFFLLPLVLAALFSFLISACTQPEPAPAREGADPQINRAVSLVSTDSITAYINDLVAFHTRHTLSAQDSPDKGIGAAVAYLAGRCQA
ncbi:MAG: hypothetical protein II580_02020, partial [Bacteroidales bacterium]|nr:hypothetical protein [Bacteroidales bacterium]